MEPDEPYSKAGESIVCPSSYEMHRLINLLPRDIAPTIDAEDQENDLPPKTGWSNAPGLAERIRLSTDIGGHKIFCDVESRLFELPMGPWPTGMSGSKDCDSLKDSEGKL